MGHCVPLCTDPHQVERLAATLQISEFELFSRAYQDWFGHPAANTLLEPVLMQYLYYDQIPCWVRHYCRQCPRPSPRHADQSRPRYGSCYAIGFVIAVVVLFAVLINVLTPDPHLSAVASKCYFPPCY